MIGYASFGTVLALIDQTCKTWIEEQSDEKFPVDLEGTGGAIRLHKHHNQGMPFGLLKGSRAVELVPMCITSSLFGVWTYLMGRRGKIVEKTALTLALAGGVSNLYDRMVRGHVVDYFSVQWKALKRVIFNLADIFVFAGTLILVLAEVAEMISEAIRAKKKN